MTSSLTPAPPSNWDLWQPQHSRENDGLRCSRVDGHHECCGNCLPLTFPTDPIPDAPHFFTHPKGEEDAESRKVQRGGQWMTLQLHHWMAWKNAYPIRDSIQMYQQCNPLAALAQLYEDQAGGQLHHDSRPMTEPMSELECWSDELKKYYFVYIYII